MTPKMMTIRQVAATGILPENALRIMKKEGQLPCLHVGSRCYVNYDLLVQMLNDLSPAQCS